MVITATIISATRYFEFRAGRREDCLAGSGFSISASAFLSGDFSGTLDNVEHEPKRILEVGNRLFARKPHGAAGVLEKAACLAVVLDVERWDVGDRLGGVAIHVESQLPSVELQLVERASYQPESKQLAVECICPSEIGHVNGDLPIRAKLWAISVLTRHW